MTNISTTRTAQLEFAETVPGGLQLTLAGSWLIREQLPTTSEVEQQLQSRQNIKQLTFDGANITEWDTGLLTWLNKVLAFCRARKITTDLTGLPEGVGRLIRLAHEVPPRKGTGKHDEEPPLLARIGESTLATYRAIPAMLEFLGEVTLSIGRFFIGKAQYRRSDLLLIIQDVGPRSLGIVSLISFLVGLIVAYMGAVQLAQFGAQIFIANLVGLGMVREMGALMTGIIMAGRTGAAFAAQLGTMQVNEEIDAFKTLGIAPIDFLVLPRMLALILVMPLLVLYSDLVGILAGLMVSVMAFDISVFEYYQQTIRALDLRHIAVGLSKGTVYGILIAFAGCLRGMQCGRSAQAVGEATTSAVVTSIVMIVVAASVMTIIYQQIGI
jgi:phospholipid/cholesterol/gamma-HCH transport system permease protein